MQDTLEIGGANKIVILEGMGRPKLSHWFFYLNQMAVEQGVKMTIKPSGAAYAPFGAELAIDEPLSMPQAKMPAGGMLLSNVKCCDNSIKLPDARRCLDRALAQCGVKIPEGTKLTSEGIFVSPEVLDALEEYQRTHPDDQYHPMGGGSRKFNKSFIGELLRLKPIALGA